MRQAMTPQEVIESRTLHILERQRTLRRQQVASEYLDQCKSEISSCYEDIAVAKNRIKLGLNNPY